MFLYVKIAAKKLEHKLQESTRAKLSALDATEEHSEQ